eukprot:g22592.t1
MISEPRVREASFLSEPSPHIDRRMEKFEVESRPNRRSLDLETRAQQRQRNWGTLRSSWLVKRLGPEAIEEIKRLLLEMERNEQAFLKQEELLQAELRLLRQRLRAAHEESNGKPEIWIGCARQPGAGYPTRWNCFKDVAALQYRADQALLMARTFDLWHRAVLSNPKEILLLQQHIEELEEALKDAEHQRRRSELLGCPRPVAVGKSLGDRVLVVVVRRGGEGEMEALQRELQEELERRQRRIEELEEALSDAEQQMRRSENEWRLKLKRAQED